jgi:hypothetical protein
MTGALASLRLRLLAERDQLAALAAVVPADRLLDRVVAQLDLAMQESEAEVLTLDEAATASGYSADHLRKCVAAGAIPNAGDKGRPRIRRGDLPRKAPRGQSGYDAGADALRLERRRLETR